MTEGEAAALGEQVFCDDELGLAWRVIDRLPEALALNRINARNEAVLRALAMLEEHDETRSDAGERAEIHRLEGKLNLVLELLSELVRERQEGSVVQPVRFNALGLCWNVADPQDRDALLEVECFALPAWPVPLRLYARCTSCSFSDGSWRLCSRFEGMTPGVSEWLEKLAFRRHRRAIALQRKRG